MERERGKEGKNKLGRGGGGGAIDPNSPIFHDDSKNSGGKKLLQAGRGGKQSDPADDSCARSRIECF